MCRVCVLKKLYYFIILFYINTALCADNLSVITNGPASEKLSSEDPQNPSNSNIVSSLENSTIPITVNSNISESNVNSSTQDSDTSFTPSVHLGTIDDSRGYETRNRKAHPFNNVQHFQFGNSAADDVNNVDSGDVGIPPVNDPQSVKEHVQYIYVDERDPHHQSPVIHHDPHHPHPHHPYAESYLGIDTPSAPPIYYGNQHHQHHPHHHSLDELVHHTQLHDDPHHHHQHHEVEPLVEHPHHHHHNHQHHHPLTEPVHHQIPFNDHHHHHHQHHEIEPVVEHPHHHSIDDTVHHPHFNNHLHHHHQHHENQPVVEHITYEKPLKYEHINSPLHYHYEYVDSHNNEPLKHPEINVPVHPYQYYYQNHHQPSANHETDIIKPVEEPGNNEPLKKPEITVPTVHPYHQHYYHNNLQPPKAHTGNIDKPETVLYLTSHRETSFTRTRKLPYKHYQPQDDTEIHLVKDEHAFPSQRRQISPWHKILHIIGAFLPLGLLIAALKPPNVIKMDSNNTEPNIVLSKFRGIHTPIEHKTNNNDTEEELCRDRSICQSILRGAGRNEKLIHNELGNFATRQSMKQNEAKKSKFHEIFQAVRKKDCNIIKC